MPTRRQRPRAGAGGHAAALKELGEHPDGGAITVRDGKYGPYVNWGKVNATLPKGKDPQSVTLEEALPLIAEAQPRAASRPAKAKAAKTAKPKAAKAEGAEATRPPSQRLQPNPRRPAKAKAAAKTKKG